MTITPKNFEECQDTVCTMCTFFDEIPDYLRSKPHYYDQCDHRKRFDEAI